MMNNTLTGTINSSSSLIGSLSTNSSLEGTLTGGQTANTNYDDLSNKPQINSVTLEKNKSFNDLGAKSLTNMEIQNLINSIV